MSAILAALNPFHRGVHKEDRAVDHDVEGRHNNGRKLRRKQGRHSLFPLKQPPMSALPTPASRGDSTNVCQQKSSRYLMPANSFRKLSSRRLLHSKSASMLVDSTVSSRTAEMSVSLTSTAFSSAPFACPSGLFSMELTTTGPITSSTTELLSRAVTTSDDVKAAPTPDEARDASNNTSATSFVSVRSDLGLEQLKPNYHMTCNADKELGCVQFEFDLSSCTSGSTSVMQAAQWEAQRRQKPILLVEVEIPGCVSAGETVFSHPLIVEAMETLFVTVLRPCRQDDPSKEGDQKFFGNSSCRTRIRFLDHDGLEELHTVEQITCGQVATAMIQCLESARTATKIPMYLRLLCQEEQCAGKRTRETRSVAVFGMYDAAKAEVELAGVEGVLATRSGFLLRQRVVEVTYDSSRLSYCALARHALKRATLAANIVYYQTNEERIAAQLEVTRRRRCCDDGNDNQPCPPPTTMNDSANESDQREGSTPALLPPAQAVKVIPYVGNMRADRDSKPALRRSILRFVPLTDLQATKANRLIDLGRFNEAMHLLSPRQGIIAMHAVQRHHHRVFQDVVDVPLATAWNELQALQEQRKQSQHEQKQPLQSTVVQPPRSQRQ